MVQSGKECSSKTPHYAPEHFTMQRRAAARTSPPKFALFQVGSISSAPTRQELAVNRGKMGAEKGSFEGPKTAYLLGYAAVNSPFSRIFWGLLAIFVIHDRKKIFPQFFCRT